MTDYNTKYLYSDKRAPNKTTPILSFLMTFTPLSFIILLNSGYSRSKKIPVIPDFRFSPILWLSRPTGFPVYV